MAVLNYRDPTSGQWVALPNIAGPTGPAGPAGSAGPAGPPSEEIVVQAAEPTDPVLDLWIDTDESPPILSAYTKVEADAKFVDVTGDVMTGGLSINSASEGIIFPQSNAAMHHNPADGSIYFTDSAWNVEKPIGVGAPITPSHAANKGYVDSRIWKGTRVEYDAIVTKDPTVLYVITG